ncbi:uncharacterized protein [Vicugna pacos]|uniref:Uncharacterized protein isoform X1 n=1 Tax=Vicugna pacos TaxID=30538 RepID=A0ABM5E529_VICPA
MSFSLYPVGRGWQACQEGGCPRWAVTERGLSQGMVFGWGPHPCCSRTSPVGASWTPGPQTPFFVELERLPWKPGTPRPRLSQAPAVSASVGRSPAAPPAGAQTRLSGLNSHVPTRTHTRTLCTRSPRTHTHSHVLTHICQHAILRLLRNPATELETTYVKEQTFVLPQDRALEWTPSELGNCWTSCHTAPHCGHSPDPAHSRPLSAGRMHSREPLTQTESRAPASAWGPWSQESFPPPAVGKGDIWKANETQPLGAGSACGWNTLCNMSQELALVKNTCPPVHAGAHRHLPTFLRRCVQVNGIVSGRVRAWKWFRT